MRQRPTSRNGSPAARTGVALLLLAAGGCATLAPRTPPPPPAEFVSSAPFELPSGCEPSHGKVYRTNFVVQTDGRVTDARSDPGDACVQQALQDWVSSFRYRPVAAAVPLVIDWVAVTARRGG